MDHQELLLMQAIKTHEGIFRRLEASLDLRNKMPRRAARTTAFAALEGRIQRLRELQKRALARYGRRKNNETRT